MKTPEGKAISSRNSYKGGHWRTMKEIKKLLRQQAKQINDW